MPTDCCSKHAELGEMCFRFNSRLPSSSENESVSAEPIAAEVFRHAQFRHPGGLLGSAGRGARKGWVSCGVAAVLVRTRYGPAWRIILRFPHWPGRERTHHNYINLHSYIPRWPTKTTKNSGPSLNRCWLPTQLYLVHL